MKLAEIVAQLRTTATSFSNRVFGTEQLEASNDETVDTLTKPSAFVLPITEVSRSSTLESGVAPEIDERFGVLLAVNNTLDDDGFTATASLGALQAEVIAALVGWSVDSQNYLPIRFLQARMSYSTSRELGWLLEFVSTKKGGSIVSYEIGVALQLDGTQTVAQVLATLAGKIATTTSGTRFEDDMLPGRETITPGGVKFRLRGLQTNSTVLGSDITVADMPVILNVLKHLTVANSERYYTEGAMQTAVSALLAESYWKVTGVFQVKQRPSVPAFPGDVVRRI